jgi:hypothetical protein
MHYSLLLLIVAVSIVVSNPVKTTTTSSRSVALVKRQPVTNYCPEGWHTLCCAGHTDLIPYEIEGCRAGMYFIYIYFLTTYFKIRFVSTNT